MKLFISDSDIDILMKKYGDPISNEINYVVILNDAKDSGEDKLKKKKRGRGRGSKRRGYSYFIIC